MFEELVVWDNFAVVAFVEEGDAAAAVDDTVAAAVAAAAVSTVLVVAFAVAVGACSCIQALLQLSQLLHLDSQFPGCTVLLLIIVILEVH